MDYQNFAEKGGPQGKPTATLSDRRWWTLSPKEAPNSISSTLTLLDKNDASRREQQADSARLYGNISVVPGTAFNFSNLSTSRRSRERITYNLCQSATDTGVAKLGRNRPKPYFLTSGGDYKTQRKAKKLNQFTEGIFYENNAYDMGVQALKDGCVWGDGLIHVFEKNGRVKWERVMSSELYVDEIEGVYGFPRQMHRVKDVDRSVLLDGFPDHAKQIREANEADQTKRGQPRSISDMVTVRESWHLPSGPDANDGKHIITIDGANLTPMQEWEHDFFPFARFRWAPKMWGFWSQGLVEQLQNIQYEINKILWVIQRSYHLMGSFKIWLEAGSKIVKEHINNEIGTIGYYVGAMPQYITPGAVPPEFYQQIEALIRRGYEQSGISQLSATSKKPEGLNSGKALREYEDIETDRMNTPGHEYERLYLDLAKLSIATAKDIAEDDGNYSVSVPGKRFLSSIDWKEIDLDEDQYVMQCFPVSSLPSDPSGRLQTVQEYAQAGYLTPRQARKLLDFPDIERVENLDGAKEEWLGKVLDGIVDEGEFMGPDPMDDLQLAREMTLEYYENGKLGGLEEDRLDLLRTFLSQVDALQQAAMPPTPMPMMGAPQAAPMPQPTSDLVQNVPGSPAPPQ